MLGFQLSTVSHAPKALRSTRDIANTWQASIGVSTQAQDFRTSVRATQHARVTNVSMGPRQPFWTQRPDMDSMGIRNLGACQRQDTDCALGHVDTMPRVPSANSGRLHRTQIMSDLSRRAPRNQSSSTGTTACGATWGSSEVVRKCIA